MRPRKYVANKRHQSSRKKILIFLISIVIIAGVANYYKYPKTSFEKPADVGFGVWFLKENKSDYKYDKESLQYHKPTATITFKLSNKNDNNVLTFTEQAVPESFAVAPQAFDEQVAGLQQVTKFDSIHGSVAITKPRESGNETAIMRAQGTLVYVYSDKSLDTDKWRILFNDMELIK